MSGTVGAAGLLAAALLTAPPPRWRLRPRLSRTAGRLPALLGVAILTVVLLPPAAVMAIGILGGTLGARRQRGRRRQRRRVDGQRLAAALETLVGELRVGAHPVTAFGVAASECDGPVGDSLRAVAARARLGADVAGGLRAVAESSSVPAQWNRLAVCWQLATEHGLAMSVLMRAAQRDIVERQRFSDRVEAGLAGARATAVILAGLPVVGVLLGQLIGAEPIGFLVGGGVGGWLLVVGVALVCVGLVWADRLTDRMLT
ncbi:type II secretion system F family protein [Candidatus Mycolicibacterium alkanivorans]|uniref:Type II secretion system F family protein n=1 Tax=Candidatus Mycolicibacterium alkanivorans TaxID=2954114 RepID=A0ABS9YUE1_9MYCO|nr:type II secretion system F family protein [Candidatus Mycolicibacterium alkanivorans]MCI4674403.1 type II secretion system F family protein [Candidatus Mycolicibacterium alkanivorans]